MKRRCRLVSYSSASIPSIIVDVSDFTDIERQIINENLERLLKIYHRKLKDETTDASSELKQSLEKAVKY